ncbi:hypothetical protein K493DRAFT_342789 [Basidiobolus meristosporus CBS 931.73]|uniref:DUF1963 domain-containing protein n=1 Tax=Basidiobolus meristosporus CBS 931.73 TaxID=1314790 RepID=A0A1Y1WZI5_9FUNG|nr:hypothetical protein K493DRAFT_342789 [Basidiobolus meristosporus CBS 931.73]|eukprot:ORX78596.1 hypothetical protein K493DRAFT_342789 [Basidiobolus meristosporus CBS 931.73]
MAYQIPDKFIETFSRPCFVPAIYHTINDTFYEVETFDGTSSKVGGIHPYFFKHEISWPVCEECSKQMTFFLQFDLDKISKHPLYIEKTGGKGLFQLFVCLSCEEQETPLTNRTYLARLIYPEELARNASETHERPDSAPWQIRPPAYEGDILILDECLILDWDQCQEIPHIYEIEESEMALKFLELERHDSQLDEICEHRLHPKPGTLKVFGWPYWIQATDYPKCKEDHCGESMHCLLQLAECGIIAYMWGDCGIASVFQCPSHKESFYFTWESS